MSETPTKKKRKTTRKTATRRSVPRSRKKAPGLSELAVAALEDMKAVNVRVLDVRSLTDITDTMIVATGTSDRRQMPECAVVDLIAPGEQHRPRRLRDRRIERRGHAGGHREPTTAYLAAGGQRAAQGIYQMGCYPQKSPSFICRGSTSCKVTLLEVADAAMNDL